MSDLVGNPEDRFSHDAAQITCHYVNISLLKKRFTVDKIMGVYSMTYVNAVNCP